jgi:hypothetical protein
MKYLLDFQLFEKKDYFKGGEFADDEGRSWKVEKVYKFVKKHKKKYFHPRYDLDKIKDNIMVA